MNSFAAIDVVDSLQIPNDNRSTVHEYGPKSCGSVAQCSEDIELSICNGVMLFIRLSGISLLT